MVAQSLLAFINTDVCLCFRFSDVLLHDAEIDLENCCQLISSEAGFNYQLVREALEISTFVKAA